MPEVKNIAKLSIDTGTGTSEMTAECTINRTFDPSGLIVFAKQADKLYYDTGDTVTYTITIVVGAIGDDTFTATFSDLLNETLEFIDGTLTINGEASEESLDGFTLTLKQNDIITIEYQCIVQ